MLSLSLRLPHLVTRHSRLVRTATLIASLIVPALAGPAPAAADTLAQRMPPPPPAAYVLPFSVLEGNPHVRPGEDLGYWLWHDAGGLHLRTTTRGLPHQFSGVIRTRERARFFDVDGVRLEDRAGNHDREVQTDNDTIRFRFVTYDGVDGIDFRLDGAGFCIDLENNGHDAPRLVHLGQHEVRPDHIPVCFRR